MTGMERLEACIRKALGATAQADISNLRRNDRAPGGRDWDSLNHMVLCSLIEDEFGILLSIEQIARLASTADARHVLSTEHGITM